VIGWSHPKVSRIVQIGAVCNNAEVTRDGILHGSPTEGALVVLAHKTRLHAACARYTRLHENAFSPETKWMAVLVQPPPDVSLTTQWCKISQ
jgi:magnesium-transporting ATPase (P-type)